MRAIGLVLLSIAMMALLLIDADAKRRSSAQGSQAAGASDSSLSISSHFPTIWKSTNVKPVMFPPGCAKPETKP